MQIRPRVLTALLIAPIMVLSMMVLIEALRIKPPANVYPIVIMLALLLLAGIAGITAIVTDPGSSGSTNSIGEPATWITMLAIAGYAFTTQFDYIIATSIFMLLLFLKFHVKPLTVFAIGKCVLISGVVTGFIYISFVSWLGVDVPSWW